MKTRKNRNSKLINDCQKTFCSGFHKQETQEIMSQIMSSSKKMATLQKTMKSAKFQKRLMKGCMQAYCNPGCKGTVYEAGKNLSDEYIQKIKKSKYPETIKNFELQFAKDYRKRIFKNKTNVLKNGFFEGMNRTRKNKLQKHGAISGCSLI